MGSAGSIAGGGSAQRIIETKYLKDSFDRNLKTLVTIFFQQEKDEVVFSDNLVYTNPPLFHWLLEEIAEKRINQLGDVSFINNTSGSIDLHCDLLDIPEIISPIEVDVDELDTLGTDIAACGSQRYALIAECLGIRDLNFYDSITTFENPFNSQAVAVNVSNNQLSNIALENSQLSQSHSILQLNIGGNALTYLPSVPSNLLFLDLSYSEEICFDASCYGVFTVCPQLLKLVLDGCGLTSTCTMLANREGENSTNTPSSCVSIFVGLVKLQELSLKENMITTVENLKGLEYFSKSSFHVDTSSNSESESGSIVSNKATRATMTLHSVNLLDNPVSESTSERKAIRDYITQVIPMVSVIDGKPVASSDGGVAVINKTSTAYKELHPVVTDNDMITETMAQEFAAALKGEHDNTVVS